MAEPPTSCCGLPLPLTLEFNFATWRTAPPDLPIPADMPLQERNYYNNSVEATNKASIRLTRAYERVVVAGASPPVDIDIGPALAPLYAYTAEEMDKMISMPDFCVAVAPISPNLLEVIVETRVLRAQAAEKKKELERVAKENGGDLKGSMVMPRTTRIDHLTRPAVTIPPLFLAALKYKLHPSLFWFTDTRLRFAGENPGEIPSRKNTSILSAGEKSFLDVPKMKTLWGSDDSADGNSLLSWKNAMQNLITAFEVLCPTPADGEPTYATLLTSHRNFVTAMDDFEPFYDVWYPTERKLRLQILDESLEFDISYWRAELDGTLRAYKAAKAMASGSFVSAAPRITDFGQTHLAPPSFKPQRPPPREDDRRDFRDRRDNDRHHRDGERRDQGWSTRDTPRGSGRDDHSNSFRDHQRKAPVCLVCAGEHVVREHPVASTTFRNRDPHYSVYEDGNLKTSQSDGGGQRRFLCIQFNTGRHCDGSGHPSNSERLHKCSLCGGQHPALSAHRDCRRFRNDAYVQ
ncbi:hypothetical protein C8R47DRAFT_1257864 [Mycena vitilis]|nr:hypothetical protein C8R47DRAFT_1257864 [Mycena vitilis]